MKAKVEFRDPCLIAAVRLLARGNVYPAIARVVKLKHRRSLSIPVYRLVITQTF
jgi:hypothetical protein